MAGCDVIEGNLCNYDGMEIAFNIIRECDAQTGNFHWEYAMPEQTGNVSIFQGAGNMIYNYVDEFGRNVDVPDATVTEYQKTFQALPTFVEKIEAWAGNVTSPLLNINIPPTASLNAITQQTVVETKTSSPQSIPEVRNTSSQGAGVIAPGNESIQSLQPKQQTQSVNQASTTNIFDEVQKWLTKLLPTSVYIPPVAKQTSSVNSTALTSGTMNNKPLVQSPTGFLDGETFGISNMYLAIGGILVGGYIWGNQRKR
jgi:hypothetical protein